MNTVGLPECVPVFTQDRLRQTDSLPKYMVCPGNLVDHVRQDNLRIKIIDLGEGSLQRPKSCCQALTSLSFLQYRGTSESTLSTTSSGAGGIIQPSLEAA